MPNKKNKPVNRCPKCGKQYDEEPAVSRTDNKTKICPDCGMKEALDEFIRSQKKA